MKEKRDITKSWLVRGASYDKADIPIIATANGLPSSLQSFSGRKKDNNFSQWIHFYEEDYKFSSLWNRPSIYVDDLKRYDGIISPDFSICPDYPMPLQMFNKYRNHAIAYWLSTQGIPVIPNVRWGDKLSYDFCFRGIEKNSVVAVGAHGQMKSSANRKLFVEGLPIMMSTLCPHTIIVYGTVCEEMWKRYETDGVMIIPFPSKTERFHKSKEVA